MYKDYFDTCEYILKHLGKHGAVSDLTSRDFENLRATMAAQWGSTRLGNVVTRTKSVFKYAYESELIDRPVNLTQFKKPSKKTERLHRSNQSKEHRAFEPAEIHLLLRSVGTIIGGINLFLW